MTGIALAISGLEVRGQGGRRILSAPHLEVPAGAAVAVRGPSGAGKSTLLYAMAGIIAPAQGRIVWGDTDIAGRDDRGRAAFRRESVGFIFQEHLLFEELSALGNAAITALYAPRRDRRRIRDNAEGLLTRLGLGESATRRSDTFSGGERQRIAVVRALAGDAPVILADEPTASLDRPNADALADDLMRLARDDGRTLIAVSHDPALHDRADHVIDVVDGRVETPEVQHA
ncbi:MAG: ATP-binding cassette domain-containing protein [Salibaculum sp.]|jgi:ABC-type lipoprotein export system ATPase subunit|uniref:ABC transporter ATP-binding protein n=1 Tax=Salibaculum sp. TaxID=2855480 RepID=UPI0028709B76|nr:ATP-binding cassette domain-containing protein [Salibaculum sp.]MDR9427977.1 ATP-binding cassette domain-containing protein [Salibaculum sp.]MDR9482315.1 ATP-binding cassette domain-containing protein [Salibaculum sp.]